MNAPNLAHRFTFINGYDRSLGKPVPDPVAPITWFKELPDAPKIPLARTLPMRFGPLGQALDAGATPAGPAADWESRLATLCLYTLGLLRREMSVPYAYHRGVPSPRCYYPSELYVWIPEELPLAPGLYHYAVLPHALERLRGRECQPWMLQALGAEAATADLVLFVTADFWRLAHFYGDFALRLAGLEAGHALENLAITGRAMGWTPAIQGFVADELVARSLGLDLAVEGVMGAVALYRSGQASPWMPGAAELPPELPTPTHSPQHAAGMRSCESLQQMQREMAQVIRPAAPAPAPTRSLERAGARTYPLPGPSSRGERDLRTLLLERNSGREFLGLTAKPEPIDLAILGSILQLATQGTTPCDFDAAVPIELVVAPINVEGLPVGLYHYRPETHDLVEWWSAPDATTRLADLVPGDGITIETLACKIFALAPARSAFDFAGVRGYRLLNLQAGAIAQRVCLAAAEHNLFCRPHLNYLHVQTEQLMGISQTDYVVAYQMLIGKNQYHGWQLDLSI